MKDELSMFIMRKDALATTSLVARNSFGGALKRLIKSLSGATTTADLMAALIPAEFMAIELTVNPSRSVIWFRLV